VENSAEVVKLTIKTEIYALTQKSELTRIFLQKESPHQQHGKALLGQLARHQKSWTSRFGPILYGQIA
jgi:hypothetical protein